MVPLLARIYPNGEADVNHFHAAGGIAFLVHTLLRAGLLHDDVRTVAGHGLWRYTTEPRLRGDELTLGGGSEGLPRPRRCCARPTTRSPPTAA